VQQSAHDRDVGEIFVPGKPAVNIIDSFLKITVAMLYTRGMTVRRWPRPRWRVKNDLGYIGSNNVSQQVQPFAAGVGWYDDRDHQEVRAWLTTVHQDCPGRRLGEGEFLDLFGAEASKQPLAARMRPVT
jgi:hypothetical protein